MISKAKSRFIKFLQVKKYRLAEQCFLVQGAKAVKETLGSDYEVRTLLATRAFYDSLAPSMLSKVKEIIEVSDKELTAVGSVEANDSALAVVSMKASRRYVMDSPNYTLVLDDIRDPGNLGTIIRTADWFGIKQIVASPETTDVYNPKVINATMGSFLRVDIHYVNLDSFLKQAAIPIYGALLRGEDVHSVKFAKSGLIVIGNESRGISPSVEKYITNRITIPGYGKAESLNASVATAIILDNLKRK